MINHKKLNKLKLILVISSISFSFIFIILIILLKDIPLLPALIKEYIESGKSFFIPSIPNNNLLVISAKKFPNANFTVGHLVDLIIMMNIVVYIESSIYHYIKKVYFANTKSGYYEFSVFYHKGIYLQNHDINDEISIDKQFIQKFSHSSLDNTEEKGILKLYGITPIRFDGLRRKRKKYNNSNYKSNFFQKSLASKNSYLFYKFFNFSSLSKSLWDIHYEYSFKPIFFNKNFNYNLLLKKVV